MNRSIITAFLMLLFFQSFASANEQRQTSRYLAQLYHSSDDSSFKRINYLVKHLVRLAPLRTPKFCRIAASKLNLPDADKLNKQISLRIKQFDLPEYQKKAIIKQITKQTEVCYCPPDPTPTPTPEG